ncbi:MAG: hypothetical protein HFJ33_05440 [Clostridia bacterium]|nr:hypothetical protein [Clostridia bacterium]
MKIINNELKFKIYNVLKKNHEEDIIEEELKKVKSISINQNNDCLTKIEAKDLEYLKYVESLSLNLFEITDELIQQINSFENITHLSLNHCIMRTDNKIMNHLNSIIVTYTQNFKLNLLEDTLFPKMIQLINLEKIDLKDLRAYKNLKYIYIYNTQIENPEFLNSFEQLKEVYLDGSNISEEILEQLRNKNIKAHYKEEYLPN